MQALKKLTIVTLLSQILCFSSHGQTSIVLKIFPASSPEQQGMSSSVLDSMLLFIKNTNQNIHHITIIKNRQTVLDADIYPYSETKIIRKYLISLTTLKFKIFKKIVR